MSDWTRGALALAAVAALLLLVRRGRPAPVPAGVVAAARADDATAAVAGLGAYERFAPADAQDAREAVEDFRRAVLDARAADADGEGAVRVLFRHRAAAQQALHRVRMRLPNDLAAERDLARLTEALDRAMLADIEEARQRLGAAGVHPGPLDAAWYGAWYRAANDVLA